MHYAQKILLKKGEKRKARLIPKLRQKTVFHEFQNLLQNKIKKDMWENLFFSKIRLKRSKNARLRKLFHFSNKKSYVGKCGKTKKIENATNFESGDFCAHFSDTLFPQFDKTVFLWYYMVTIFQRRNTPNNSLNFNLLFYLSTQLFTIKLEIP